MDVPPKEERGIATERDGADEAGPDGGVDEELEERDSLEEKGEDERRSGGDLRQDSKGCVPDEAPGDTVHGILIN